jgi:hypothetical protein
VELGGGVPRSGAHSHASCCYRYVQISCVELRFFCSHSMYGLVRFLFCWLGDARGIEKWRLDDCVSQGVLGWGGVGVTGMCLMWMNVKRLELTHCRK